jgi:hypothetical protein
LRKGRGRCGSAGEGDLGMRFQDPKISAIFFFFAAFQPLSCLNKRGCGCPRALVPRFEQSERFHSEMTRQGRDIGFSCEMRLFFSVSSRQLVRSRCRRTRGCRGRPRASLRLWACVRCEIDLISETLPLTSKIVGRISSGSRKSREGMLRDVFVESFGLGDESIQWGRRQA